MGWRMKYLEAIIMKAKTGTLATLALGFIIFGFISAIPAGAYTIIIYGTEYCGFTQAMRHDLDSEKYRYAYYDVKKDDNKNEEMWKKVRLVCPTCELSGSVKIPVMDLNGQVYIRPSFEEVKKIVGSP